MLNNFIYAQTKDLFLEALEARQVLDEAIVFIEDTKEIWNHGTYFGSGELDSNVLNDIQLEISQLKDTKLDKSGLTAYALKTDLKNYLLSSTADSTYAKASTLDTFKEGITNRVQTLENWHTITDTDATDEAINRWKDVESFLSGIKDTENLDSILNGIYDSISSKASSADLSNYLSLSGGTIKGASPYHQYILTLDTDNVYYTIFRLNNQGVQKGYLAWADDDAYFEGIFISNTTTNDVLGLSDSGVPMYNKNTLLHSGNVGTYALPIGGGTMGGNIEMGKNAIVFNLYQSDTWANPQNSGLRILNTVGTKATEASSPYAVALSVSGYYGFQLASDAGIGSFYYRNTVTGAGGAWKQIAFADSDITGNAATATDADMLDGKHLSDIMNIGFDNTLDLDTLYSESALIARYWVFANSSNISNQPWSNSAAQVWTLPGNYNLQIAKFYNSNDIRLRGYSGEGWTNWQTIAFTDSDITGYSAGLKHSNGTIGAIVNSSGNVGIGTTNPQYKLDVIGDFCVNRNDHGSGNTTLRISNSDNNVYFYADDADDAVCSLRFVLEGTERLRLTSGGDTSVIGSLSVSGALTASAGMTITGDVTINGNTAIHSGNIGSYNAGSATKLQTPRTIWGQSFDGTGDMSGNLNLGKAAIGHSFSDTWTDSNGNTHLWHGLDFTHVSTGATLSSYYGLTFKVGAGQMLINSSGNVGIGTTTPAYKLDVNGSFNATSGNIDGNAIATQTWVNNSSNGALAWASYTTATTVASVPIGYKIVKCTVSASGSFSLASTSITAGREIHVIVNNSGSSDIAISLPTTGAYVNLSEDSLTIPASGYAEINIISDGSKLYIRTLA